MRTTRYEVPTKVLCAQGRQTVRELDTEGTAERRAALQTVGLDATQFRGELAEATGSLEKVESDQERAKAHYVREARQDQAIADEGYRYKLAMDARARAYIALHGDEDDLAGRLRFGQLRRARARGLIYELRVVLPELEAMGDRLAGVGLDAAYIARGREILARLAADKAETAEAQKDREAVTRKVREGEAKLSRLLGQLAAADQAIALENPAQGPVFRLDIVRAELGRLRAGRDATAAASEVPVADED